MIGLLGPESYRVYGGTMNLFDKAKRKDPEAFEMLLRDELPGISTIINN